MLRLILTSLAVAVASAVLPLVAAEPPSTTIEGHGIAVERMEEVESWQDPATAGDRAPATVKGRLIKKKNRPDRPAVGVRVSVLSATEWNRWAAETNERTGMLTRSPVPVRIVDDTIQVIAPVTKTGAEGEFELHVAPEYFRDQCLFTLVTLSTQNDPWMVRRGKEPLHFDLCESSNVDLGVVNQQKHIFGQPIIPTEAGARYEGSPASSMGLAQSHRHEEVEARPPLPGVPARTSDDDRAVGTASRKER